MKHKFILFIISIFTLQSCMATPSSSIVFIGNEAPFASSFTTYYRTEKKQEVQDVFLTKKASLAQTYQIIEKNSTSIVDKTSIRSTLKGASAIVIQVGNIDIYQGLTWNEDSPIFTEEILNQQLELFSYYYFALAEEIRMYSAKPFVLLSPYNERLLSPSAANQMDFILDQYCRLVEEVAVYFSATYVDIRSLSTFLIADHQLNEQAKPYLAERIWNGIRQAN